jgi:threonine/homoserine/homoserine lactone efflux protein
MALSILSAYAGLTDDHARSVLLVAMLCAAITVPCSGAWSLFGSSLRRLLASPRVTRAFNLSMAALFVASIAPVLFE